ncbi:hypothetical protein AVEN_24249-1 [Araneus ventricosus]|uniref:Retrovirus-related Pol polyprotein from transposon TNT 1-94 n=1 Tax=Araneus ventricosus TaxID=182803 RepID=A0A4Y2U007_ARAVE|nr:hypothetical protein AVEN_24249-1 [Araneus ventricosus]
MNGIADRENRTFVSSARRLLLQSGLPMKFWAEAMNCAVHIRNRSPTRGLHDENQTPFQKLFGKKPTVKHFQTFDQKEFALNQQLYNDKYDVENCSKKLKLFQIMTHILLLWKAKNVSRDDSLCLIIREKNQPEMFAVCNENNL